MRCGKSCRLRWINYLRPDLKRGMLSSAEEDLIIRLHASYGNKWSRIAAQLPGRTDNEIKNCWNTRIKKKLQDMGIDPVTHKPLSVLNAGQRLITGVKRPPRASVNVPPSLGHPSGEPLSSSAYLSHRIAINRFQEGLLGTSPNSVISPQSTTSLSHTPPTTKCEDEHSIDYSADSVSHDCSIDSNAQASVHEFANEDMFQGDPHMMFACQLNGMEGLWNAPHMLSACHIPIGQEVHIHPHMHNPVHMLHNATHMHNPPHMLLNVPHIPPHMQCNSDPDQPTLLAYQVQALQAPLPTSEIEDGGILLSSSTINESNDGCNAGYNEVMESGGIAMKDESERMMALNYTRNASRYLCPSMNKYLQEGGVHQASQQLYGLKHEGATTSTSVQGGQWSNMMSADMFLSEQGPHTITSPLPYEMSNAFRQHNFAGSCNSALNIGQWSNMDGLWVDPMPLTN